MQSAEDNSTPMSLLLPGYVLQSSKNTCNLSIDCVGVKDDHFMRSKLAFRDTSNKETLSGMITCCFCTYYQINEMVYIGATIIRKRDGSKRIATPLEEMSRSWGGKQPMYLDIALHEKLIDMQRDFDGDNKKAQDVSVYSLIV